MEEKAADELGCLEDHGLVSLTGPIGIWGPVVLPLEGREAPGYAPCLSSREMRRLFEMATRWVVRER